MASHPAIGTEPASPASGLVAAVRDRHPGRRGVGGGPGRRGLAEARRERELKAAAAAVVTSLPRVTVVTAKTCNATTERVLPGDSHPLLEAAIYARTTGYLKSRRVNIGDHVKEGDLLAEIAAPEIDAQLEQARAMQLLTRANLIRDQATEELAGTELNRSRNLLARQAARSRNTMPTRPRRRSPPPMSRRPSPTSASIEATIQRLETLQSFQKVVAPFSGVITARNVDPGDLVSADSPTSTRELFHLVQIDTLRVFVNVPQVFSTDVKVGQKAVVYPSGGSEADIRRHDYANGRRPGFGTRTLLTEVQVPNRVRPCGLACTSR